ncbi:MAG: hypothetical protein FJ291_22075 [Planctomycetes bacterium]|nr:hypothetical protein [Planctomycetota bacterium]
MTSDGQAACFRADEPRKGMKWSAPMPLVSLDETPWLALRYRAESLDTQSEDYLVYLDDAVQGRQLHALRLCDTIADGQWHTVAVEVSTLTEADGVHGLAVQVQATEKGNAKLWLDWLAFHPDPPKDAQVLQRVPAASPKPDWVAPLAEAKWAAHTAWLSNPAPDGKHSVERKGEVTRFAVAEPSRGMKWSWDLPEPAPLEGHRYVSLRYRGTGLRPVGDYALCVLGKPRTAGLDYTPVISDTELVSDGRWHTLTVDIRKAAARFPAIGALALQVQAAPFTAEGGCATLEVADIRFVNAIQPSKLSDSIDWQPGARFDGFAAIPLGDAGTGDSAEWRRHLRLADWFSDSTITMHGIPFSLNLPKVPNLREVTGLAATGVRAKAELRFPCGLKASEVYLLLLAALVGPEEPVFGGGKFRSIRDLDRFRLRLEYADGTADECLPLNAATRQFGIGPGPQVLVAAADPSKPLKAVVLRDASRQAAFAAAALTARTAEKGAFPEARDEAAAFAAAAVRFPRTLRPGESSAGPARWIRLSDSNWRRDFDAYRASVKESLKPLLPRKQWFREIFNFRQRFLHWLDPLYDAKTGELHLERAVEEAKREFGGIDYLHLFDWGNCGPYGRIYGRTGDYSPYDYIKGGRDALRKAIEGVQKQGVPVGLYIEGYLLTARGKLGQAHGKDWQIITRDGKPLWWPGNEEMMVCPGVPAWCEVQASTYETKVKELGVDGMYIDQFGFADPWKDCYSDKHGHPTPSCPAATERETTKLIRERVEKARPGVAIYTEETPVDVTTPFQDGSFTYAMSEARRTQTLVPINMARFAFPDFKTIEILVCDKPTGSWATGVKWVFFNGEAIWLEGPPDWFEPETREAIRRCYRVLRKHKDAFTSLEPVPLVPTEMGGVWANKFPVAGKTVYTLYNARHRTVRGEVLRVPYETGATYHDEWRERPAAIRREGNHAIISLELGPNDVGCLVVEKGK